MRKQLRKFSKDEFFLKVFGTYWKDGKQHTKNCNEIDTSEKEFVAGATTILGCKLKQKNDECIDDFIYRCYCHYYKKIKPMYEKNKKKLLASRKNYGYTTIHEHLSSEKKIRVFPDSDRDWGMLVGFMDFSSRSIESTFFEAFGRWCYFQPMFLKKGRQKKINKEYESVIKKVNEGKISFNEVLENKYGNEEMKKNQKSFPAEKKRRQIQSYADTHEINIKKQRKRIR